MATQSAECVYKVVNVVDGRLLSLYGDVHDKWAVQYFPEQNARGVSSNSFFLGFRSLLFAFTSLKNADKFRADVGRRQIWEAEAYGARQAPNNIPSPFVEDYSSFWRHPEREYKKNVIPTPPGTVLCEEIRLLRRVK